MLVTRLNRVVMFRVRWFGDFRFANTRFRFIVSRPLTIDVIVYGEEEVGTGVRRGTGGRTARTQLTGIDWTTPAGAIYALLLYYANIRTYACGKSREILIAMYSHFAPEIEGGHLDPSRKYYTLFVTARQFFCSPLILPDSSVS